MKNRKVKMCIAKKEYRCSCCMGLIPKGTKCFRVNLNYEGIYYFCDRRCASTFLNTNNENNYICNNDNV